MRKVLEVLAVVIALAGCSGGDEESKWVCSCRVDCPEEQNVIENSTYDFCGATDETDAAGKGKAECESSLGALCGGLHTCTCTCQESGETCGG